MDFIDIQRTTYPDLSEDYALLGSLYEKKLWHQLSLALETFVSKDDNIRGDNMIQLYDSFISTFETRLNSIKFAGLISSITRTLSHDMVRLLAFLKKVLGNREKLGLDASMCLDMEVAMVHTEMGELSTAKAMLETAKESLHTIKSSESYVFSKFYKATFVYRKVAGPANEFYNASLMFLAYTSVDDLRPIEKIALATDMALAAITGDDIYNFGEVLATPILKALKDTPSEWLLLLVEAMNNGHVDHFNSVLDSYHSQYTTQPVLQHKHDKVIEKMRLLAVLQLAFERPSHSRVIAFQDISNRIKVSNSEVEWVLMRGMSLGLIKGSIDEVDETVNITWVQPRVLDKAQISLLHEQLQGWTEKVKNALITIEDEAAELYV